MQDDRLRLGGCTLLSRRSAIQQIAAFTALGAAPLAAAETFPDKQIEIINSFSPGGTSDLNLRAIESSAARVFGKTIIQTFKPGGGGISGTTEVAFSKPDGYKLLVVTSGELTAGPNLTKTSYSLDSFAYIGRLSSLPYGFVVRKDAPWKDFKAFQKATADTPGKVVMGTTPRGGAFLAAQHLIRHADLKVTVVPYSGSGPYVTAVIGGHVDAALAPLTSTEAHIQAGSLRLLAVTGTARQAGHPDVPTFAELGLKVPFMLWVGLVAPAKVPADRLAILRSGFAKATQDPAYIDATQKLAINRDYADAATFEKQVREEYAEFKTLTQELGLTPK